MKNICIFTDEQIYAISEALDLLKISLEGEIDAHKSLDIPISKQAVEELKVVYDLIDEFNGLMEDEAE